MGFEFDDMDESHFFRSFAVTGAGLECQEKPPVRPFSGSKVSKAYLSEKPIRTGPSGVTVQLMSGT